MNALMCIISDFAGRCRNGFETIYTKSNKSKAMCLGGGLFFSCPFVKIVELRRATFHDLRPLAICWPGAYITALLSAHSGALRVAGLFDKDCSMPWLLCS